MFIEFETTAKEKVLLNVNQILYVTKDKKSTIVLDINGVDYRVSEDYESLIARLQQLKN